MKGDGIVWLVSRGFLIVLGLGLITNAAIGSSALHKFAKRGDIEKIHALIEEGVELDWTDKKLRTALMIASEQGHLEVVETLLYAGADPSARDKRRRNVLRYAKDHPAIVEAIDFALARKENKEEAYRRYLAKHSESKGTNEARSLLEALVWADARKSGVSKKYASFVEEFPVSDHRAEAEGRWEGSLWSELVDNKRSSLEDYEAFLEQFPNGTHSVPAKRHIGYLKERLSRTDAHGRVWLDETSRPLKDATVAELLKRVNTLIAPITLEELEGDDASQSGISLGSGVATGTQTLTRDDGIKLTVLSARRGGDSRPTNIGVWHGRGSQGGFAGLFGGNSGEVVLRLNEPLDDAPPFGFRRVRIFGKEAEFEYTYENGTWSMRRYELSE